MKRLMFVFLAIFCWSSYVYADPISVHFNSEQKQKVAAKLVRIYAFSAFCMTPENVTLDDLQRSYYKFDKNKILKLSVSWSTLTSDFSYPSVDVSYIAYRRLMNHLVSTYDTKESMCSFLTSDTPLNTDIALGSDFLIQK